MKYICFKKDSGVEEIFTFPRSVNHDCASEMLRHMKDQTHSPWQRERRNPISAGFVDCTGKCHGESITLDLRSRPEDSEILNSQMGF